MDRIFRDLRYALRSFTRSRFVTGLALVAFALGIGITTAVFSIFNSVLLRPLPYPTPERLVVIYDTQPACNTCPASFPKYVDWKERSRSFEAMGGSTPSGAVLTGRGAPERVTIASATASLGTVFGVQPASGRWFSADEDQPGARKVAVLTHAYWTRRFGADPAIVGDRLILNDQPHDVIGIMPEGFTHRNADLFVPLARKLDPATRRSHFLSVFARLAPGVTLDQATSEMRSLGHTLASEFGQNHGIDVRSYHESIVGSIRTPLRVLLGAVLLVLLIACANVANLLLASGLSRRRELAVRLALGAGQRDLARQLVTEAVLLAIVGGMLGLVLAAWAVRTFVAMAGTILPRGGTIAIDGRVLAFTAVVSLAVGVVCGLWPLIRLRTRELASAVRETDTRTGSSGGTRFGNGLVAGEIAVAFALLVGASLLVKNLILLQSRDAGMQTARVVAFDISPSGQRYSDPARSRDLQLELLARLRGIGGVESAGMVSHLPMYRYGSNGEMNVEGGNPWDATRAPLVEYRWILGDYFATLGIRLIDGRLFDDRDGGKGVRSIIVNRAMAEKFWPGRSALGKRVSPSSVTEWWEVVGVVENVRSIGLTAASPFEMYRSIAQQPYPPVTVVMRTQGEDPSAAVQAARQIVASLDPALPVATVQTMDEVVSASVRQPRLLSALSGMFGLLAGLLAMVGVYGVTAYNVRRQRREFGIRLALGAEPGAIARHVVRRGMLTAAAGLVCGGVGALLLTRTIASMLNDVQPTDPAVFAGTAAAVFVVAIVASYFPARSAGRVDPMVVLRDA